MPRNDHVEPASQVSQPVSALPRRSEDDRPLSVRLAHLLIICLMLTSLLSALEAFNFTAIPRLLTRDGLFILHRGAGLAVALLAAGWLWLRRDFFLRSWVGRWHALMLGIAFLIPFAPWLARLLEGRFEEAIALIPVYNLVSRPENALSYLLFSWHRKLLLGFAVLVSIHASAALFHALVLKDRPFARIFSWRKPR